MREDLKEGQPNSSCADVPQNQQLPIMENSSIDKFSAYVNVARKFTALCMEENVLPIEAWMAIGRLGGFGGGVSSNLLPSGTSTSTPVAREISLTPEEKKKALELAIGLKAKRMGVTPSEVNLTSSEAQEAVQRHVFELNLGKESWNVKKNSFSQSASPSDKKSEKKPEFVGSKFHPSKETSSKTSTPVGDKSTAKTRLASFRRIALRAVPPAVADSTVLHLVSYSNARRRLKNQWKVYQESYGSSGISNPMKGLPNPWNLPLCGKILRKVSPILRVQMDSPETYVLMDENSRSYWDRDKPNLEVCPAQLQQFLGSDVLSELNAFGEFPVDD
jgi:hypothetical protein